jgi:hypothetical protein
MAAAIENHAASQMDGRDVLAAATDDSELDMSDDFRT